MLTGTIGFIYKTSSSKEQPSITETQKEVLIGLGMAQGACSEDISSYKSLLPLEYCGELEANGKTFICCQNNLEELKIGLEKLLKKTAQ